jgi:hypothetical protein
MDREKAKGMTDDELKQYRKELNAQRNRERRQRAKENGDIINIAKKEKRKADKAIITPPIVYEVKDIKKVKELPKMKTEPKQEITKKNYIGFIKRFYKKYTGKELDGNADVILKINEQPYKALNISKQFKQMIINNFDKIKANREEVKNAYAIFRGVRGFIDIEKRLCAYDLDYQQQYQEKRSVVEVEDIENLNISFDTQDILNNIEKLDNKQDKIIYGTIMMLRCRVGDLNHTIITKNKNDIKNDKQNWIYGDKLYINKTKNTKKNIIDIPKEVRDLYGDVEGYLFGNELKTSTLSLRVIAITKKIYGKSYTYLNIRHLYATYINNKASSYKERYETAKQSGHNIQQQLQYAYRVAGND